MTTRDLSAFSKLMFIEVQILPDLLFIFMVLLGDGLFLKMMLTGAPLSSIKKAMFKFNQSLKINFIDLIVSICLNLSTNRSKAVGKTILSVYNQEIQTN
jgi:hypothetical protein